MDATAQVKRFGWLWPALALFAVSLAGIGAWLADELIEGEAFAFDTRILLALRVPGQPQVPVGPKWLLQSMVDISALGGPTLLWGAGIAGLIWLLTIRKRAEAATIAVSLIGSALIDNALKAWIARPRPELIPHLVQVTNASFPSGHAMVSAAVYLTLALMLAQATQNRVARAMIVALFSLIVLLIGCSRVYLGVHWPSDVLAGWCFGVAWAVLVWVGDRWVTRRHVRSPAG